MKRCGCSRSARVFPFRLSWEAIRLFVFFPQILDEVLTIIPVDLFDREILFVLKFAWLVAHDIRPLFLGHEVNAHIKAFRQRDLVLRFLSFPYFLLLRTAHLERARRNPDELHANAVREVLGRVFFFLFLNGQMAC